MPRGGARPGAGRKPKKDKAVSATTKGEQRVAEVAAARARSNANLVTFKPGQSGNPKGRKKGSRNKLGDAFVDALHEDFDQHGTEAIQKVRTEMPHQYLKVIASIVPKEMHVKTSELEEMTDDQLAAGIAALRRLVASEEAREGSEAQTGDKQAPALPALH